MCLRGKSSQRTHTRTQCTLMAFYLVEAQEVLNGRGRVEDVALGRHHHYEPIQSLKKKKQGAGGGKKMKMKMMTMVTMKSQ